jgi:hypothetical protein
MKTLLGLNENLAGSNMDNEVFTSSDITFDQYAQQSQFEQYREL